MTINELLRLAGVAFKKGDAMHLGDKIKKAAKQKGIRYTKKEELLLVNDYPEEFKEEMIQIAIEHFQRKNNKTQPYSQLTNKTK